MDFDLPNGGQCAFVDEWTRISQEGFERSAKYLLGGTSEGRKLGKVKAGDEERKHFGV